MVAKANSGVGRARKKGGAKVNIQPRAQLSFGWLCGLRGWSPSPGPPFFYTRLHTARPSHR